MTARHGHVLPSLTGATARCGGPAMCPDCRAEQSSLTYEVRAMLRRLGVEADDAGVLEILSRWVGTEKALRRLKGREDHGREDQGG